MCLFFGQIYICMGQNPDGYYSYECEPGLYWNSDKHAQRYNYVEGEINTETCDLSDVYSAEYCCEVCPVGTYRESTQTYPPRDTCKLCPKGKFSNVEQCKEICLLHSYTECDECTGGTYNDELGQSSCKSCPGANMIANVERCNCVGGEYGFEGSGIFDADTFRCVSCAADKTATQINQEPYLSYGFSSVGLDGGGWNFESDVPDYKCLHNTIPSCNNSEFYDIVNDICTSCPEGKYRFYTPLGYNASVPGRYDCDFIPICNQGEFFNMNMPACVNCEAGKYSGNDVLECIDCPVHFYSLAGASTCIPCETGKFQFQTGQSSCMDKCLAGYYFYQESGCKKCQQENTFTDEPNLFSECLQCPNGKRSFYDEALGDLLKECTDCDECPVGQYRTGCSGNQEGTCQDCLECPEGEINVGCRWTKSQNEQPGTCFPEELVVRTPTCPETGKSDESSSGLGGFSFTSLFGLDENGVDFQCSTPCVGSPTEDGGFCDGPHPCNIRACSMTSSDNIFDFEDRDGVAGQTFRQARACPVEFDENELKDSEYLEFGNFTRINQKRKIRCQSCLECGSSGLDENAPHVNNYGRGCAHECTLLLCQVGEIWDWTRKQCVHCNELEDIRLCLTEDVDLTARDISGNRPRVLVGGGSCREKPTQTQFESTFQTTYGECTECATLTCPDSFYHASCREEHCRACLPHTSADIFVPLYTQEFLDGNFETKFAFCQFAGCEVGRTGVKNNGELCSASCLQNMCQESDIHVDCTPPHLSNRCVPNVLSSQYKFGMLQESTVLGSQSNVLEPLGTNSHFMHSSFENTIIVLSEEAPDDELFQCVWNAIDIKDNFHDPAGISGTFFPHTSALADQISARGSKHCHERTSNSSVSYASLPLQNVISFENYDQHRILLDNPARVMAWDRYSGSGGVCVDCPQHIEHVALQRPPDANLRMETGAYFGDLFLALHMKHTTSTVVSIPLLEERMSKMSWVNRWLFSCWMSVLTTRDQPSADSVVVRIEQAYETTLQEKNILWNFSLHGNYNGDYINNIRLRDFMNVSESSALKTLPSAEVHCFSTVLQFNFLKTQVASKQFTSYTSHSESMSEIERFSRNLYEISSHKCHSGSVYTLESANDIIAFKRYSKHSLDDEQDLLQRVLIIDKNYVSLVTLKNRIVHDSIKVLKLRSEMQNLIVDGHFLKIFLNGDTSSTYLRNVFLYAQRISQISTASQTPPFLQIKFWVLADSSSDLQERWKFDTELGVQNGNLILSKCASCVEEYQSSVTVAFSTLETETQSAFFELLTPEALANPAWSEIDENWRVLLQLKNIELDAVQNFAVYSRDITEVSISHERTWSITHSLHKIETANFVFDALQQNVTDNTFESSFRQSNRLYLASVLCSIKPETPCTLQATAVSYTSSVETRQLTKKNAIFIELQESRYETLNTLSLPDLSLIIQVMSSTREKIYRVQDVVHPVFKEVYDTIFHGMSVFTILDKTYITLQQSYDDQPVSVVGKLEGFSETSNIGYCVATESDVEFTTSSVPFYKSNENLADFVLIESTDVKELLRTNTTGNADSFQTPAYISLNQRTLQDAAICFQNNFRTKYKYMNFLIAPDSEIKFTCNDCLLPDTMHMHSLSVKSPPVDTYRQTLLDEHREVSDGLYSRELIGPAKTYSTCLANEYREIKVPENSQWEYKTYWKCDSYIELPDFIDPEEFPNDPFGLDYSWGEKYDTLCKNACDRGYGSYPDNWKDNYVYCYGFYREANFHKCRICISEMEDRTYDDLTNDPSESGEASFRRDIPLTDNCNLCPENSDSPGNSIQISDCVCREGYTRNGQNECLPDFISIEKEYVQFTFEENSSWVEYFEYETRGTLNLQDIHTYNTLKVIKRPINSTERVCLVGNVSIVDVYESNDDDNPNFNIIAFLESERFRYTRKERDVSHTWKPYSWVGSHKYANGNQFLKLHLERKESDVLQDLGLDVTVGIDALQLLPLFNYPHTSNSHANTALTIVQIPHRGVLMSSGLADMIMGNNIQNWEKIVTNVQIVSVAETPCTYRIKIIPMNENSFVEPSVTDSAIDAMGCTVVSPGFCQLEIPTQILNSHRQVAIMATFVGDPGNSLCYIQDSTDETFDASGHQFSVTVLPLQRIFQCDQNHFWSENEQVCKSCTEHDVVCPIGEYIEGCDVLGLNITCQSCPAPEGLNPNTFTWGDDCEILCQEGYYKTDEGLCLQCTSDLQSICFKTPGLKYQACSAYANEECIPCEPIAMGIYGAYEIFTNVSECATTCMQGTFRDNATGFCVPCSSHEDVIARAKLTTDADAYYRTLPCTAGSNRVAESCVSKPFIMNGVYTADAHSADEDCLVDCPEEYHQVKKETGLWSGYDCISCDIFDSSGARLPKYAYTVNAECDLTCNHSAHYYHRGQNMTIGGVLSSTATCSYCNPTECKVGTFMTGVFSESCQCHNCTLKYNGLVFTSEGKALDDSSSCHQECPYGSFGNEFLQRCIPWTPIDEELCGDGFYFKQGTPTTDAMCLPCTQCTNSRQVHPCTNTSDAVCVVCPDAGPGAIYENSDCTVTCMDGYKLNQVTQKCEDCRGVKCPPGSILSAASYNCSHCIPCSNSIPSNSTYIFGCTWKCHPGHFYNIHKDSCVEYSNYIQYSSTISQRSTVSCPYDHYLSADFTCDQCENYPEQNPSNLKPQNTSTWSWVPSIQTCTWECNPPFVYFVHIAFYQHTSPKCYTVEEREEILKEEQNTNIAISENSITLSKVTSKADLLPPILVGFFIIFAIFMFIFAFFYPLLVGTSEHIGDIEEVQETPLQQEELDQKPDRIPSENAYV